MTTAALTCDEMRLMIEIRDDALYDPTQVAIWDTVAVWDDPQAPAGPTTWDDMIVLFDAKDFLRGFTLEMGRQTSWDDLLAATLNVELDNSTGAFSIYGHQHTPRIRPGFAIALDCRWGATWYPQFRGTITEHIEAGVPDNYGVKIKAVDKFRRLQDPIDGDYHAGTDAQDGLARIQNLLAMAAMSDQPFSGQPSIATMTNYATSRTLLEEIIQTAHADCGVFFVDKDGTMIYLNRNRTFGRDPIHAIPLFGDGCDGTELPYAAVNPIVADNEFGNVITCSNVSQGTDSPQAGIAVNVSSINSYARIPWSPAQLLICNAGFVQGAADFHLALRSEAYYRIDSFECYPVHDDRLWPVLLGLRLYDLIRVTRRAPNADPLMALMIVDGMRIEGTPHMWKFVIRCSPASGYAMDVIVWDDGETVWDDGASRWV